MRDELSSLVIMVERKSGLYYLAASCPTLASGSCETDVFVRYYICAVMWIWLIRPQMLLGALDDRHRSAEAGELLKKRRGRLPLTTNNSCINFKHMGNCKKRSPEIGDAPKTLM